MFPQPYYNIWYICLSNFNSNPSVENCEYAGHPCLIAAFYFKINLINKEKGGGKAWFPEQKISNKDFPYSWKFSGDMVEMLSSLTPNTGPVLTNTWAKVEQSNMWRETRRCPFIRSTVGFCENNQQPSTARRHEEQFLSPLSHGGKRNQIIKCEKQCRKRKRGWTFMHGYLP